ncbi:hypothetical protein BaRGS_00006174 [Batillaria attramentaria]|uniref:Secreted protein n=1 Tax=Batillaria attramentaria TaxID=370345 RepID=A0ABD0LUA3_9CAEN
MMSLFQKLNVQSSVALKTITLCLVFVPRSLVNLTTVHGRPRADGLLNVCAHCTTDLLPPLLTSVPLDKEGVELSIFFSKSPLSVQPAACRRAFKTPPPHRRETRKVGCQTYPPLSRLNQTHEPVLSRGSFCVCKLSGNVSVWSSVSVLRPRRRACVQDLHHVSRVTDRCQFPRC